MSTGVHLGKPRLRMLWQWGVWWIDHPLHLGEFVLVRSWNGRCDLCDRIGRTIDAYREDHVHL